MKSIYWYKKYKQKVAPEMYGPEAGKDVKPWQKRIFDIITMLLIIGAFVWFVITFAI